MKTKRQRHNRAWAIAVAAAACLAACVWAGQAAFAQEDAAPPEPAYGVADTTPPPPPPPPQGQGGYGRGGGRRRGGQPGQPQWQGQGGGPGGPGGPGQCPQAGGGFQRPGPPDPDVIFDQMDANGDEMLSREEFRTFHEQHRPPHPPMGPPPGGMRRGGMGRGGMPVPPEGAPAR